MSPCVYPTLTPFGQELEPGFETGIQIINPFQLPSYEPDVATWFWDTLLGASPILGIPANSLNQIITNVVTTPIVIPIVNTAISTINYAGNVANNVANVVNNVIYTGIGGPTLPVFYIPSTNSPFSTGSN